jgi:hypothetical protein
MRNSVGGCAGFGAALSACTASADQSPGEAFEVTKTDAERKQPNGDQYRSSASTGPSRRAPR